jgi:hypothetical protein
MTKNFDLKNIVPKIHLVYNFCHFSNSVLFFPVFVSISTEKIELEVSSKGNILNIFKRADNLLENNVSKLCIAPNELI